MSPALCSTTNSLDDGAFASTYSTPCMVRALCALKKYTRRKTPNHWTVQIRTKSFSDRVLPEPTTCMHAQVALRITDICCGIKRSQNSSAPQSTGGTGGRRSNGTRACGSLPRCSRPASYCQRVQVQHAVRCAQKNQWRMVDNCVGRKLVPRRSYQSARHRQRPSPTHPCVQVQGNAQSELLG